MECPHFWVISASFQKVARTSSSMLLLTISLSLHVLEKHQPWPTNVLAVSAATLRASETPEYLTSSSQRSQWSLRPFLCPGSHSHFFRKQLAYPTRQTRNPDISLTVGTQKNTHTNVKTLWKCCLQPESWQQFEEHCMQRNNCPQRSKKKKRGGKNYLQK